MEIKSSDRINRRTAHFLAQQQNHIQRLNDQGIKVINLGRGNPDLPTSPNIVEKLNKESLNPKNHGYPPYGGKESLKIEIINFYLKEYGVHLQRDEVTIFNGSLAALTALPMILVNPNEVILSPDPAFFGYQNGAYMAGGKIYRMELTAKNGYLPDLQQIPADIRKKAKLMFLNYPHNPTGAGATSDFFENVVDFAEKNEIVVAHDFAYSDISFGKKAPSFLATRNAKTVGVEIYTLSKTFNMAGWRIAFAVGNRKVIKLLKQYVQSSLGGTFGAIQDAASFALKTQDMERANLKQTYLARRNVALSILKEAKIEVLPSAGTFFLWVKLPLDSADDIEFAKKLLEKKHIAVVAGSTFGSKGRGYLRVSLVSSTTVIEEGMTRLVDFIKNSYN